jgi:hypothetical protein
MSIKAKLVGLVAWVSVFTIPVGVVLFILYLERTM